MSVLRISSKLYETVYKDLTRPHSFAAERVGFIFCGFSSASNLLIGRSYEALADSEYERTDDEYVGARFNRSAIRRILNLSLQNQVAAIHVHYHADPAHAGFSQIDLRSLSELIPSFSGVSPNVPHGAIVLTDNEIVGLSLDPGDSHFRRIDKISVVGFPTTVWTVPHGR